MTLKVDATALAGLPAQLERLRGAANDGQSYVLAHTALSYGGILNRITGSHEGAVERVRGFLDRLANPVAGNGADAVQAAIRAYETTDQAAAERLDDSYPVTGPVHAVNSCGIPETIRVGGMSGSTVAFADVANPTARYTPPPDRSADYQYQPLIAVSPAAFGRAVIVEATGLAAHLGLGHPWDPYEAVLKPLTGDWNGLRGCADVFGNVAGAVEDMAANLRSAAGSVHSAWEGNAADGMIAYLLRVAAAVQEAKEPLLHLAEAYEHAADGAHELFGALGEILDNLMDTVVAFIAEASAAVATSETIIGGLLFGGAAAYDAYRMYELIKMVVESMALADAIVEAVRSAGHGFGAVDGDIRLPELETTRPPLPGNQGAVGQPVLRPAPDRSTSPTAFDLIINSSRRGDRRSGGGRF